MLTMFIQSRIAAGNNLNVINLTTRPLRLVPHTQVEQGYF